MEIDVYFPDGVPLSEAGAAARDVQQASFAMMWVTETRHKPFLTCGAALAATERIRVGSGITVAFPAARWSPPRRLGPSPSFRRSWSSGA